LRDPSILPCACLAALLAAAPAFAAAPAPPPDPAATLAAARAKQATAEYADAAEGFERFVTFQPNAAEAPEALTDAVVLRLGLHQNDLATRDVELYVKNYGAKRPAEAARVRFALAAHAVEEENWSGARDLLSGWGKAFDGRAPLDLRLQAHALLGRALVKLNDDKKAEPEYALVRDLWRDQAAGVKAIQDAGSDDRQLAKALTAVGEARFFFAERARREVEKIRFPEFKGKADRATIAEWTRTKVAAWSKNKQAAIQAAEKGYLAVLEIQPMAPPRWVIASASRAGQMWGKFTAEFRAAPIPREWKGRGTLPGTTLTAPEVRALYYQALDEGAQPMKAQAKAAFKTCVDYSVKYQYADEFSRQCHEWLNKNYRAEFHAFDALLPRLGTYQAAVVLPEPLPEPR
jgi:hypothetical protein